MPPSRRNGDLHGNVPDTADIALVLIDVINDLEFEGGDLLAEHAFPMAERLAAFKDRVKARAIPVIYVNDNFGKWQSDRDELIAHCLHAGVRGKPMVERLCPDPDDYFVLKPKHSGFFSTTLDTLLTYLGAKILILAGLAGNICILFTANDAYMRDYDLVIPTDCVASNTVEENEHALQQMRQVLKAEITPAVELDLDALQRRAARVPGPGLLQPAALCGA